MSPAALGSRPGGTEAPLAYVFRALDLLEVHRRGRRKAAGIRKSDGGRLAPALPFSLPSGRSGAREAAEPWPKCHPGPSVMAEPCFAWTRNR